MHTKIILIDDDELIHLAWKMEAAKKKVALSTYFSVDEFLEHHEKFEKESLIYIDSDLGDDKKGEVESKKIFDLGFKNIVMATAHRPQEIDKPSWIKKIIGKRPEF